MGWPSEARLAKNTSFRMGNSSDPLRSYARNKRKPVAARGNKFLTAPTNDNGLYISTYIHISIYIYMHATNPLQVTLHINQICPRHRICHLHTLEFLRCFQSTPIVLTTKCAPKEKHCTPNRPPAFTPRKFFNWCILTHKTNYSHIGRLLSTSGYLRMSKFNLPLKLATCWMLYIRMNKGISLQPHNIPAAKQNDPRWLAYERFTTRRANGGLTMLRERRQQESTN